ncbi:MAG: hypothetical protein ABIR67_09705 [Gaiellaceae bacterium]
MNADFRKVALIAAALGLLVSLFFALRPDDDRETAPTATVQTTPVPTTTEAPPATTDTSPGPGTIRIDYTITGGKPDGGIARDSVARGRIVVIRVTADVADHVHLHGYDLMADVKPGKPATIRFTATAPGRFELELEDRGVQIGELEVRA